MNLIDCYVTEVLSKPYQYLHKWWVNVKADCYGRETTSQLMFDWYEEALKVTVGYKFES